LATALGWQSKLEEQIAADRRAVELAPDNADYRNSLGYALFGAGQEAAGLAEIQRAIELDPQRANYHDSMGELLTHLGRFEEA
jgi:Flp pilus assembly protein TadD